MNNAYSTNSTNSMNSMNNVSLINFPQNAHTIHNKKKGFDSSMARYAIAFDMDTRRMQEDNVSDSQKSRIYQTEITTALAACGFVTHAQGSLYHTEADTDPIAAIMMLQSTLKDKAPNFCKYAKRIHVFRMEEWSDVTKIITGRADEDKTENIMDFVM